MVAQSLSTRVAEAKAETGRPSLLPVVAAALAYLVIGVVTAYLAGVATSIPVRTAWRLIAWGLSLVVFVVHLLRERRRAPGTAFTAALRSAAGVALGAFAVAAAGPMRAHWGQADQWRAALALVLWPLLTGVPAFLAALAGGALILRREPQPTAGTTGSPP